MSRRRGSRLFSGHPGLILVSEDIPGITMPAPPADLPPLEDEEPDFDLMSFRQEEDAEEEAAVPESADSCRPGKFSLPSTFTTSLYSVCPSVSRPSLRALR